MLGDHVLLAIAGPRSDPAVLDRCSALVRRVEERWGAHVRARVVSDGEGPTGRYGNAGALYLMRPDGHIGFRSLRGDGSALEEHLRTVLP